MRKKLVLLWLSVLLVTVLALFWYQAWVYALPTPVPSNYVAIHNGTKIQLPEKWNIRFDKPVFLHFYNPDCPCSKFNLAQFTALVKQYRSVVNFVIVPMTSEVVTSEQIQKRTGLDIPIITDTTIAKLCGVYSTPQAALLTTDATLYYRGNYNKNRYCTDKETSYARMAIDNVLSNKPNNITSLYATTSYGCSLPKCTRP